MNFEYSNGSFVPYESFDYIFENRKLPEFGNVPTKYVKELPTWRFFFAENEGLIPFGFESQSFDDADWDIVNVPSVWQMNGYSLPQNLLYNYPEELDRIAKRGEETIGDKYIMSSTSSDSEEVGIYRASVVFTPEDINRAIYLETAGICGRFEVYLNGKLLTESHSVLTDKRLLLSDAAKEGVNQIAIIVYRWDRNSNGHIIKELMNFGFSGIFRPIRIVTESLIELSNLHISAEYVPDAYINEFTSEKSLDKKLVSKVSRGSYRLRADFKLRNHTDYMFPYSVRVSVMESKSEYDPYKLPYAKIDIKSTPNGTIDSNSTIDESFELTAIDVAQWTDATPIQYDLIMEILDSEERIICVKKRRFGFRTTEAVMNKFQINDKTLQLLAIKYFEFDPKGGIAISLDRMRQDIVLMKRCGINCIISQNYPLSDELLNLCDQYGLYVIAGADRQYMVDYVESAMNHPSVIMWAFNDYGFNVSSYSDVKNKCRLIDATRPWYCTADSNLRISDVIPFPSDAGVVFGPWSDLCIDRMYLFGNNRQGRNLFESIPGRTRFDDDTAEYKWIHHADLVGGRQKINSCIGQGIVDAERKPHPVFADIKQQCQSIKIFSSPDEPTNLTMRNSHPFAYTPDIKLEWKILLGGVAIMSGQGNISEIEPFGIRNLKFPINYSQFEVPGWANGNMQLVELYEKALSHELIFDISLKLADNTYFAAEGYEVAFYQEVLLNDCADPKMPIIKEEQLAIEGECEPSTDEVVVPMEVEIENELIDNSEYEIVSSPNVIRVGNDSYSFAFSRKDGALNSIKIGDRDFLMGNLIPSFYRCPSNIDRTDRNFILAKTIFSKESDYEAIQSSIEYVGSGYTVKDNTFSFISRYKSFAMKGEILVSYEISDAKTLRVTLCFTPKYDMVRYGFRVPVTNSDVLCTWYGRGPGESYYDRKNATRFGVFSAGIDKIYHPYARPAENSSHTDTETLELVADGIKTLRVRRITSSEGNFVYPRFDFTVLPFTPEQMNEYLHEELLMHNDFCELFLDFCSKEIERTHDNNTVLPLKKNCNYKETFEIKLSEK